MVGHVCAAVENWSEAASCFALRVLLSFPRRPCCKGNLAWDATNVPLTVPAGAKGGSVPPGPQRLSRNWSCSASASKAVPQPQGRADEPPWCFRTMRGGAPPSALQPGWHKCWGKLSRHLFVPFFISVEVDCFTRE